jgi:hypothetical protein
MSDDVDLAKLRVPFTPELVGKLPRVTCGDCSDRNKQCSKHSKLKCGICQAYVSEKHIHIDYVGHADVTDRLLSVDPEWEWKPAERDIDPAALAAAVASGNPEIVQMVFDNSPPKFDLDRNGSPVGLWIKLTIGGVTRPGYGSCPSGQSDAVKVLIGDALRNAAMRFGVALDLWAKGDRADPAAENATASAGQAARRGAGQSAGDAWDDATPAPARQNGTGRTRGQVSRPAPRQQAQDAAPEEIDPDAQALADEAHGALTVSDLEGIHKQAREAGKVGLPVRNPSSGGIGKLAVYLDWRRKQVKETDDALADLSAAARERDVADLDSATAAQMRMTAKTLRGKAAAA